MKNFMIKLGMKAEKFSDLFLLILCALIFGGFSYYSLRYTYLENGAIPVETKDGNPWNILFLLIMILFSVGMQLLQKGKHWAKIKGKMSRFMTFFILFFTVFVAVVSIVWARISHVAPTGDGSALCNVVERMMLGYFVDMKEKGYMFVFPHQFNLLSVIHGIFVLFGVNNYHVFQYINALCMPLMYFSLCQIIRLVYGKEEAIIIFSIFFSGFLPMFLYVPYVYGEIISITFTAVLMWQVVRFCKTDKISSIIWGSIAGLAACFVRQNSLIVIIAVSIVLMVHAMKKMDYKGLVWILIMLVLIFSSGKLVNLYYESISGLEVSDGIPYISWIRMGMRDNFTGPGWFDNSSVEAYEANQYDAKATAEEEAERIKEILEARITNPRGAVDFYKRKVLSQWNMPTYYCFYETKFFDLEPEELPGLSRKIYFDKSDDVIKYANAFQFMLYSLVFLSAVMRLFFHRKSCSIEDNLLIISVMGGFFFSILWESRARYVLPYAIYALSIAAMGVSRVGSLLCEIISWRGQKSKP